MNSEVIVKVEGVSKKFCRDLKLSLWYGIKDITSEVIGRPREQKLRTKEFWAVKDVSFELKRGECLGLIGHNGAGKSTLLKMLNGLIKPDQGTITMKGRIGALIELGTGFNPILTGRENIYNNGSVLGFTKKEIDQKFDAIIEFSEVSDFIDTPVQNYSSGMKVRLGFAVAAQMEPDVLLIDEVLAVGDLGFRIKCLNKISELLNHAAVILVSHTMPQISRISTKAMLMEKGKSFLKTDDISLAISEYYKKFDVEKESIFESGKVELKELKILNSSEWQDFNNHVFQHADDITLKLKISIQKSVSKFTVKVFFINSEMRTVLDVPSDLVMPTFKNSANGINEIKLSIPNIPLNSGKYGISLVIQDGETEERIYRHDNISHLNISSKYMSWCDCMTKAKWQVLSQS